MLLPDEFLQRSRAHALRQGLSDTTLQGAVFKEIHRTPAHTKERKSSTPRPQSFTQGW
jgi:hypothetical protein